MIPCTLSVGNKVILGPGKTVRYGEFEGNEIYIIC